jgi:methyl-accepting chemotaxis protein
MIKLIKKKLANQLSFYILFAVTTIFIIIASITYNHLSSLLKDQIKLETSLNNKYAARQVQTIFDRAIIVTEQMSLNHQIKNYLHTTKTRDDIISNPLFNSVMKTLIEIEDSYDLNFLVWVANEDANFFMDSSLYISDPTYDVKIRPWYDIAINNQKAAFTSVYIEWETKEYVISSILALRENNIPYGFIGVDTNFDSLPEIFNYIDIGERGSIFLVDDSGRYIFHPNEEMILENSIYDKGDKLRPYSNLIFKEKEGFKEITIDGEKWYLAYYPATENGWLTISLINKAETQEGLFSFTLILISIFFITIIVLFIVIYITVKKVTLPIQEITEYSKQVSSGNFFHDLPNVYSNRDDEIADLSRSFVIITDVFREKNMVLEASIEEKNEEINRQYKYLTGNEKLAALGTLVAGVAHEVNTPIGVALTSASYIEKISKDTRRNFENNQLRKGDLEEFLSNLDESLTLTTTNLIKGSDLVRSFKAISVDQEGEMKVVFNLHNIINSVTLTLKHEYKNRPIVISNYCAEDIEINSYPGPFSQILTNLIINSLKHAYHLDDNGIITLSAEKSSDMIIIHYTDDGYGIDTSNIGKIFDPFFTTNRKIGSSGLGLHIVHNIVTQVLGGTIECESEIKSGVHFIISLPLDIDSRI